MTEFTALLCQCSTWEHGGLEQEAKLHPKLFPGFNSLGKGTIFLFSVSITLHTMGNLGLSHCASVQMINTNVLVEIWFLQVPFYDTTQYAPLA